MGVVNDNFIVQLIMLQVLNPRRSWCNDLHKLINRKFADDDKVRIKSAFDTIIIIVPGWVLSRQLLVYLHFSERRLPGKK
jgi:hypothetical protein